MSRLSEKRESICEWPLSWAPLSIVDNQVQKSAKVANLSFLLISEIKQNSITFEVFPVLEKIKFAVGLSGPVIQIRNIFWNLVEKMGLNMLI